MRALAAAALGAIAVGVAEVPIRGGLPPIEAPSELPNWWAQVGAVVGLYSGVRLVVVAALTLWAGVLVLRSTVAGTQVGAALAGRMLACVEASGRRAGWAGLVRVTLGLSATGVTAAGCAVGGGSALHAAGSTGPRAAAVGPAAGSAATAHSLPAPVLVGPPPGSVAASPQVVDPMAAPPATTRRPATTRPPTVGPSTARPPTVGPSTARRATGGSAPAPAASPSAPPTTDRSSVAPAADPGARTSWTVKPGDDLWSIASYVVSRHGLSASRVGPYWARLIEANREHLAVPADPSLIFPGDVLVLPALAD